MKKFYSIVLVLCLILSTLVFTSCGSSKSVDVQFEEDLMKGLSARWELTSADENEGIDDNDTKGEYESYINAELDVISKYKEETFEDEELGELAKLYIDVLERSKDTLDYFGNYEKWGVAWDEVYNDRTELLLKLNDKLEIQFADEGDQENFDGMLSEGKVVNSVRKIMETTKFEKTASDYGWNTYTAIVENTTDETFDYFSFELKLKDKDGVTIETTYASTDNWAPEDKVKFEFETDAAFSEMEIVGCDYYF